VERQKYSSDLTVDQYNKISIFIPQKKVTAPRTVSYHEIINAILYRLKNGCTWEDLPHDFPDYKTVFHYFNLWTKEGIWDKMLDELKIENRTSQKKQFTFTPHL
jgi:putative transposase